MKNLPQVVADRAAKAVTMSLEEWIRYNPFPLVLQNKFDGTRVWAIKSGNSLVMATKHNGVYTEKERPGLAKLLHPKMPNRIILDCEYIRSDESLNIFDVIQVDTKDVTNLPLTDRLAILNSLPVEPVRTINVISIEQINKIKDDAIANGGEGVMIKNPRSKYGDANAWLKLKRFDTFDVWVTGRDFSHEGPTYYISCFNPRGQIVDLGKVGSFVKGIDHSIIKEGTVLEIQFQETTKEKRLRHPFALKIRRDKVKEECINQI